MSAMFACITTRLPEPLALILFVIFFKLSGLICRISWNPDYSAQIRGLFEDVPVISYVDVLNWKMLIPLPHYIYFPERNLTKNHLCINNAFDYKLTRQIPMIPNTVIDIYTLVQNQLVC